MSQHHGAHPPHPSRRWVFEIPTGATVHIPGAMGAAPAKIDALDHMATVAAACGAVAIQIPVPPGRTPMWQVNVAGSNSITAFAMAAVELIQAFGL